MILNKFVGAEKYDGNPSIDLLGGVGDSVLLIFAWSK
jgi:hypothetical protein